MRCTLIIFIALVGGRGGFRKEMLARDPVVFATGQQAILYLVLEI
jgi:hypothetical protein